MNINFTKFDRILDIMSFSNYLKTVYGHKTNTVVLVKNADGTQLFTDMKEISHRWKEHFHQLLNQEGNVDNDATDRLTAQATIIHLNDPITMQELRKAVKAPNVRKAPGLDGIPAEVIKHGGHGLLQQLLSVKCTW